MLTDADGDSDVVGDEEGAPESDGLLEGSSEGAVDGLVELEGSSDTDGYEQNNLLSKSNYCEKYT